MVGLLKQHCCTEKIILDTFITDGLREIQFTLGFASLGLATKLGIATAMDLHHHYIIVTLDITTPNFSLYVGK